MRAVRWLARVDPVEAALSMAAFLGVTFVGVLPGIAIAIGLSLGGFVQPGVAAVPRRARPDPGRARLPRPEPPSRLDAAAGHRHRAVRRTAVLRQRRHLRRLRPVGGRHGSDDVHTVILAAEPITDIDTTAIDELVELDDFLPREGSRS